MTAWRGKWALVSGASAGIGQELAKQLAADGVHLVLTARRADRLAQLAGELRERHKVQVEICVADLARPEAPRELRDFTERKSLPIEILINNAGFGIIGDFSLAGEQQLIEMAQVNVVAVLHLTRLFLPAMVERHSGYVMIVASTASFQPVPYLSAYAATKAFDMLLAGGLAEELRPHGIRVCALCPGPTATEFQQVAGHTARMDRSKESAEKVARIGLRALAAGKPLVISGFKNWAGTEAQRLIPRSWVPRVIAHMYKP